MSKFFNALAVAVLGIALLMGAASADPSDDTKTTTIVAQYSDYITVTAPGSITTWALSVQDNVYYVSGTTLPTATIASNYDGNVNLKVNDARTGFASGLSAGHMTNNIDPASATKQITAALKVQEANTPGTERTLSATKQTIYTLTSPNTATKDIKFTQTVANTDAAGTYYMTVTFTGTITA